MFSSETVCKSGMDEFTYYSGNGEFGDRPGLPGTVRPGSVPSAAPSAASVLFAKVLFLRLLSVFLVIALFVMAVLWALFGSPECIDRPTVGYRRVPCYTPDCVDQTVYMMSNMNMTGDICHEFSSYACGRHLMLDNHPTRSHSSRNRLALSFRSRLSDLLLVGISSADASSFSSKANLFYGSCVQAGSDGSWFSREILQLINSYGGISVPGHISSKVINVTTLLHNTLVYNFVETFFSIEKRFDKIFVTYPTLSAAVTKSSDPDSKYVKEYKDVIKKVLSGFNNDYPLNKTALDAVADGIIHVEFEIRRLILSRFEMQHLCPIKRTRLTFPSTLRSGLYPSGQPEECITLSQFGEIELNLNWFELFIHLFGPGFIEKSTRLMHLPSIGFIQAMDKFIVSSDHVLIRNYILWSVICEYLPLMGPKYRGVHQTITGLANSRFSHIEKSGLNDEVCLKLLEDYMGLALDGVIIHFHVGFNNFVEVKALMNRTVDMLQSDIIRMDFRDSSNMTRILKPRIDFCVSPKAENVSFLNSHYKSLSLSNNVFENIISCDRFMAVEIAADQKSTSYAASTLRNIKFDLMKNELTVPALALRPPLYSAANSPGVRVTGLLSNVVLVVFREMLSSELVKPTFSIPVGRYLSCFARNMTDFRDMRLVRSQVIDDAILTWTLWKTFEIYRVLYRVQHPIASIAATSRSNLPGLDGFSDDQLFFISFAQSQCPYGEYRRIPPHKIDRVVLTQTTFTNAFRCKNSDLVLQTCLDSIHVQ